MTEIKPLVVGMSSAAQLLDCGDDRLYQLIKSRQLDSYLDGNRRKITVSSIEAYINKQIGTDGFQRGRYPLRHNSTPGKSA
jgi:excisionase family DNA binding protein